MRTTCNIDGISYTDHEIHDGLCVNCRETSDEANEFDFIRAWYSLLGERTATANYIASRIECGHLPNILTRNRTSRGGTEEFLRTLANGAVVMNNGITIVDVVALPGGAYRTVRRRDETDTLLRKPNRTS